MSDYSTILGAIRTRFDTQIATPNSLKVQYDNTPAVARTKNEVWARWTVVEADGTQATTGAPTNTRRLDGVAIAQLFSPLDWGDSTALGIADDIWASFSMVTASGVTYLVPSIVQIGGEELEWQINVTCPWFAYITS